MGGPATSEFWPEGRGVTLAAVTRCVLGQQEVGSEWTVDKVRVPWDGERMEGCQRTAHGGAPDCEGLACWVVTLYRCVLIHIKNWTSLNFIKINQTFLLLLTHNACGK